MGSFCKCKNYSYFFSKNISAYAIFNDQSFDDTLTNNIVVPRFFEEKWRDTVFGFPWGVVRGAWCVARGEWCVVPSF